MSNHLSITDLIALKVNELVRAYNALPETHYPIDPLDLPYLPKPTEKPVNYPEYNRSKVDHTTLGG